MPSCKCNYPKQEHQDSGMFGRCSKKDYSLYQKNDPWRIDIVGACGKQRKEPSRRGRSQQPQRKAIELPERDIPSRGELDEITVCSDTHQEHGDKQSLRDKKEESLDTDMLAWSA